MEKACAELIKGRRRGKRREGESKWGFAVTDGGVVGGVVVCEKVMETAVW